MNWSVSAIGMPEAVAKAVAEKIKCPSEPIKKNLMEAIFCSLQAFPKEQVVSASAGVAMDGDESCGIVSRISLSIEPIQGFVG